MSRFRKIKESKFKPFCLDLFVFARASLPQRRARSLCALILTLARRGVAKLAPGRTAGQQLAGD
jgi:hypothetical protein